MLQDPKILPKVGRLETTYSALRYFPIASVAMEFAETSNHFRSAPDDTGIRWRACLRSGHARRTGIYVLGRRHR